MNDKKNLTCFYCGKPYEQTAPNVNKNPLCSECNAKQSRDNK